MLKRLLLGFGLPLIVVLCNGIVAWRLGGLSHSHFTWEAFAQVYLPSPTPTATPTPTANHKTSHESKSGSYPPSKPTKDCHTNEYTELVHKRYLSIILAVFSISLLVIFC